MSEFEKGIQKARSKENNNHMQGRSGSMMRKKGPAVGNTSGNPTASGKIKRSK